MSGPPDVVFFGDSITFAWPVPAGEARVHRGIPAETAGQMLPRFDADVIALAPRTVHIMAGVNDVLGNDGPFVLARTIAVIREMVARAQAAGIAVVLASIVPLRGLPWPSRDLWAADARRLDVALRALAEEAGAAFVDYAASLDDGSGAFNAALSDDGLHPNAAGYAVMEPLARAALDRLR